MVDSVLVIVDSRLDWQVQTSMFTEKEKSWHGTELVETLWRWTAMSGHAAHSPERDIIAVVLVLRFAEERPRELQSCLLCLAS